VCLRLIQQITHWENPKVFLLSLETSENRPILCDQQKTVKKTP
jgi:hypothetical protein